MTVPSLSPSPFSHEQVVFCHDRATGLRAIIGIYSTALGPGPRRHPVLPVRQSEEAAARRRAAALRAAWPTRTPWPGWTTAAARRSSSATPRPTRREALLRAYGRFVECLGGRYVTACDVGTYVADMDVVGKETRFATGRTEADGGAGDSSVLTAYGVFQGMRACAEHVWGEPTLAGPHGRGRRGRQGRAPARPAHLLEDGAHVVVDRRQRAGGRGAHGARYPQVDVVTGRRGAGQGPTSTSTPRAPSAAPSTTRRSSRCSAADRLRRRPTTSSPTEGEHGTADRLMERGITYAPDFLVNAGGVIQVSDELHGFDFERARARRARDLRPHRRGAAPGGRARHHPGGRGRPDRRGADGGVGSPTGIWLPAR